MMKSLYLKINKNRFLSGVFLILFFIIFSRVLIANAAINQQINYQGKLTNNAGVAVADGTYNIEFKMYVDSSTTTALWTETNSGGNKVQVTNGLFSILLGSTTAFTGVDFNQTLYLGVNIGGTSTPAWDGEMSPRKKLGAVPAAFEAYNLGGASSTQYLRRDQAGTSTGALVLTSTLNVSGLVTLGNASTTNLSISGNSYLGSILSGTWNGTMIGVPYGGTGTSSITGVLKGNGTSAFSAMTGLGGYVTRWTDANTLGTGLFLDNGTVAGINATSSSYTFNLQGTSGINPLNIASSTGTSLFTILQNGNVGIGTTTPFSLLTVGGNSYFGGNLTAAGTTTVKNLNNVRYCDQFASLQACYNDLPTDGGTMILAPNSTTTITSTLTISKPNVTIKGGGIDSTFLVRGSSFTDMLLNITSNNVKISDLTIDGGVTDQVIDVEPRPYTWTGPGSYVSDSYGTEVQMTGAYGWFDHVKVLRMRGEFRIFGDFDKVTHSVFVGYNFPNRLSDSWTDLAWIPGLFSYSTSTDGRAPNGQIISGNRFSGYNANAIFLVGTNAIISNNYFSDNHWRTNTGGGQIDITGRAGTSGYVVVEGNTLESSLTDKASGIETEAAEYVIITNNTIKNHSWYGIAIQGGSRYVIKGNVISNSGRNLALASGIHINQLDSVPATDLQIVDNTVFDDQDVKTQAYGVHITNSSTQNYIIANNDLRGSSVIGLLDAGTTTEKQIFGNLPSTLNNFFAGNMGIGTTTPTAKLQVIGTAGSSDIFALSSSTNARLFTVTATGRVGIGTSTPSSLLEISTTANSVVDVLRLSNLSNAAAAGNAISFYVGTSGSESSRISQGYDSTLAKFYLGFKTSTDATDVLRIVNGKLGIGTTTPSAKLDVYGSAGSSDIFALSSSTNARLFTVSAGGNLSMTGTASFASTTFTNFTAGSIPFFSTGGSLAQNNSSLFWDNTNSRLGVGTTSPSAKLDIYGTAGSGDIFALSSSTNARLFTVNAAGNVGIGTTTSVSGVTLFNNGDFITKGPYVDVRAYGAKGDGTTDDTAAIQAAINSLPARGGKVFLPPGQYRISSTLVIGDGTYPGTAADAISTKRGVAFVGGGGGGTGEDVTVNEGPTMLLWYGASGGTMMRVDGPISGVHIEKITFDGLATASTSLKTNFVFNSVFRDLTAIRYSGMAFVVTSYVNHDKMFDGASDNYWENIYARYPTGNVAGGLELGPSVSGGKNLDVARNTFMNALFTRSANAAASSIILRFVDATSFYNITARDTNGGNTGNALEIIPPSGLNTYPASIVFYNSPLIGTKKVTGTWGTTPEGIMFSPLPIGDDSSLPNHVNFRGITNSGIMFGSYNVGTTTPASNALFSVATSAVPLFLVDNTNGNIGIGVANPTSKLHLYNTQTDNTSAYSSAYNYLQSYNNGANSGGSQVASESYIKQSGGGSIGSLFANKATVENDWGAVTNSYGYYALGKGTLSFQTMTNYHNYFAASPSLITDAAITNSYGLYIDTQKMTGVTKGYGLYQVGTADINYMGGKLGIGTTSPGSLLEISTTNTSVVDVLRLSNLSNDGAAGNAVSFYLGTSGTEAARISQGYDSTLAKFYLGFKTSTDATDVLRIVNGKLGIGTTTPSAKLDVYGSAGSSDIFALSSSTNARLFTVTAAGNVGIGTVTPTVPLTVGVNTGNNQQWLYTGAGGYSLTLKQTILGGDIVGFGFDHINNSVTYSSVLNFDRGNIGIGTTTPSAKLALTGTAGTGDIFNIASSTEARLFTVAASGAVRFANDAGSNGYVLKSVGTNGSPVWVATSTLGITASLSGGTNGYVTRWTSGSTVGSGLLIDNGTVAGVNATSSSYTFNVQGSAGIDAFKVASSSGTSLLTVLANGNVGVGPSTPDAKLDIYGTAGSADIFAISSSTNARLFTVTADGNVGIGTSTPSEKLTVQGNVLIGAQASTTAAWTTRSTASTGQIASGGTNGIGSTTAMTVYNGSMYVGTASSSGAAEIYRFDGGTSNWTKVSSTTAGVIAQGGTSGITSIASMIVYNGQLYVGTGKTGAAEVYRYDGNTNWTRISSSTAGAIGGVATTTAIDAVSAMAVNGGFLYIGTQKASAAEVYRYDIGIGNTRVWSKVSHLTNAGTIGATVTVDRVSAMVSFQNTLYIATQKSASAGLYRYDGPYTTPGNGFTLMNQAAGTFSGQSVAVTGLGFVRSMTVFNGRIYLGVDNGAGTARVLKWDGNPASAVATQSFQQVSSSTAGIINEDAGATTAIDSIGSMAVYKDALYVGTIKNTAAEVYRIDNGNNWTRVSSTTAGVITGAASTNINGVYSMNVYNDSLWIGTGKAATGAEVYSYTFIGAESFDLKFNAASDLSGLEQNGNLNTGTIKFLAKTAAFANAGNLNTGVFSFSHGITTAFGAYDLAEDYPTRDDTVEAGDVISIDVNENGLVTKSSGLNDKNVIGIYSANPALRLSQQSDTIDGAKAIPVALAGRVPVKVTLENGPIAIGDYLMTSTEPGKAAKATHPGRVIGRALSAYYGNPDEKATVTVFIGMETITWNDLTDIASSTADIASSTISDFALSGDDLMSKMVEFANTSIADIVMAVTTKLQNATLLVANKITAIVLNVKQAFIQVLSILPGGSIFVPSGPNQLAGVGFIATSTMEVFIQNNQIDENSSVFLTPTTATDVPLFVAEKRSGEGFLVRIVRPAEKSIKFDWFFVKTYKSKDNEDNQISTIISSETSSTTGSTVTSTTTETTLSIDEDRVSSEGATSTTNIGTVGDTNPVSSGPVDIEPTEPTEPTPELPADPVTTPDPVEPPAISEPAPVVEVQPEPSPVSVE